jgi:hypothetical protein
MPQHARIYCGKVEAGKFALNWDAITARSFVVITACEGPAPRGDGTPERVIGNAVFTVGSIAPYDGGVEFFVTYSDWTQLGAWWKGSDYTLNGGLSMWVDFTVFDSTDPTFG